MELINFWLNLTASTKVDSLLNLISTSIIGEKKICITYITANSYNQLYKDKTSREIFSNFNFIHPDGIGLYLASKFLLGKKGFSNRFTGSDFYLILLRTIVQKKWRVFFFGDKLETLEQLPIKNSELKIVGYVPGYQYDTNVVIKMINETKPNILIVGLGQPQQESWIIENKDNLDANVIIAVGDGIKVFSDTKHRGSKFIQKIGLEWLVRLFFEPARLWKRYIIGIPLFIYRIILFKRDLHDKQQ